MATDSRNIDYATKYSGVLDQINTHASFTDQAVTRGKYTDVDGVASVYIQTIDTSDFLGAHTGPQFGDASVVGKDAVRKDVELFYDFNKVIPNVDVNDTAGAEKNAGIVLSAGIKERYVPLLDKIRLGTAISAAIAYGADNIVAYDQTDVVTGIDNMIATLANQLSNTEDQWLFIANSVKPYLDKNLLSTYVPVKNDGIIQNGKIQTLYGVKTVFVPDSFMNTISTTGTAPYAQATFTAAPTVKAVLWDKKIMHDVRKLYNTYLLTGENAVAAGYDGPVIRGLFRPGAWVVDADGANKSVVILQDSGSTTTTTTTS